MPDFDLVTPATPTTGGFEMSSSDSPVALVDFFVSDPPAAPNSLSSLLVPPVETCSLSSTLSSLGPPLAPVGPVPPE